MIKRIVDEGARDRIPELKTLLNDPYPNVRIEAARAIGHLGSTADQSSVVAALSDESPGVRAGSAWALGELGCSAAVAA